MIFYSRRAIKTGCRLGKGDWREGFVGYVAHIMSDSPNTRLKHLCACRMPEGPDNSGPICVVRETILKTRYHISGLTGVA